RASRIVITAIASIPRFALTTAPSHRLPWSYRIGIDICVEFTGLGQGTLISEAQRLGDLFLHLFFHRLVIFLADDLLFQQSRSENLQRIPFLIFLYLRSSSVITRIGHRVA